MRESSLDLRAVRAGRPPDLFDQRVEAAIGQLTADYARNLAGNLSLCHDACPFAMASPRFVVDVPEVRRARSGPVNRPPSGAREGGLLDSGDRRETRGRLDDVNRQRLFTVGGGSADTDSSDQRPRVEEGESATTEEVVALRHEAVREGRPVLVELLEVGRRYGKGGGGTRFGDREIGAEAGRSPSCGGRRPGCPLRPRPRC